MGRVLRVRGHVVDENLGIAFPNLSAEERTRSPGKCGGTCSLMIAEIAHTPRKVHETNWKEHSHIVNQEAFVRTLLSGRPLVLISGHYGNFELGGYLMGLFGFPTYTVARELDNRYLDRFVNRLPRPHRPVHAAQAGSGAEIKQVLDSGGILTLLGDQSAGQKGCWVNSSAGPPRRTKPSRCSRSATTHRRWSATPAASANRCSTKSARRRSAIRANRTSNCGPCHCWRNGTPTSWRI